MPLVPDLSHRPVLREQMDDFSIDDERLASALRDLRLVNRYLGGFRAVKREMAAVLNGSPLRVLDLGCGLADIPQRLAEWGHEQGTPIHVYGIDANPATVAYARKELDARTPGSMRDHVDVSVGNVFDLSERPDHSFDVVMASLFLHHFYADDIVTVLQEMDRISSLGIVVNDLHRHPAAYLGVRGLAAIFPVSEMFAHDGPASVRRGFRPEELRAYAGEAGLQRARIRRAWAYRLILTTLPA